MPQNNRFLVCVFGPTAVGKTELTINLARHFNAQIVSADSRQFYKEMSIGTAKPSKLELDMVKHYFIDSHSITKEISAGMYEKESLKLIDQLFKENNVVMLTGGSGLYIQAVTDGLPDMPEVPSEIRERLNQKLKDQGLESLVNELKDVDPEYFTEVDKSNPQRITRALEMYYATGKPFSSFRSQKPASRPFEIIKIGLDRPREELYDRINRRVDSMIAQGLFDEVKELIQFRDKQALRTVGYKEVFEMMDGLCSKEEAIDMIKQNSRRYAKRQLTWFRKESDVTWFHPDQLQDIITYIESRILNE